MFTNRRHAWFTPAALEGRPAALAWGGVRDVTISGEMIRLGQLLKLAGLAASGAEAKALLGQGDVWVNGEAESRRGRQLLRGDTVRGAGEELRVV